jgi:hypothetical protein
VLLKKLLSSEKQIEMVRLVVVQEEEYLFHIFFKKISVDLEEAKKKCRFRGSKVGTDQGGGVNCAYWASDRRFGTISLSYFIHFLFYADGQWCTLLERKLKKFEFFSK